MSDDVVSEARALLKALDDARKARYEAGERNNAIPGPAEARAETWRLFCEADNRVKHAHDMVGRDDLVRELLALVDEQRSRLDALAPLAEAAARVREARAAAGLASAAYGVAYDAWRVSPETHAAAVSRCLGESEQARRALHDAERALLAHLALARGER